MSRTLRYLIPIVILVLSLPFLKRNDPYVVAPAERTTETSRQVTYSPTEAAAPYTVSAPPSSGVIEAAFQNGTSNLLVRESGIVHNVLSDDNDGSRHQRFIVQLSTGHTILIAHNIDLAPRVANINVGDVLTFQGEYEWKPEGGVVHWTHHNPRGTMPTGYIQHGGRLYQ